MKTRVILALDQSMEAAMRSEMRDQLEELGWEPIGKADDMWKTATSESSFDGVERRVRKAIEFAAFTAGIEGQVSFVIKYGTDEPRSLAVRIGSGGRKTDAVKPKRFSGANFATEKVPSVGRIPGDTEVPQSTQLKTAF